MALGSSVPQHLAWQELFPRWLHAIRRNSEAEEDADKAQWSGRLQAMQASIAKESKMQQGKMRQGFHEVMDKVGGIERRIEKDIVAELQNRMTTMSDRFADRVIALEKKNEEALGSMQTHEAALSNLTEKMELLLQRFPEVQPQAAQPQLAMDAPRVLATLKQSADD